MKKSNWMFLGIATVILMITFSSCSWRQDNKTATKVETQPVVNKSEQAMFLQMTEGDKYGPSLSFVPDPLIQEYRQEAANTPCSAEEMMSMFHSLCDSAPAYTGQKINDSIFYSLESGEREDFHRAIKRYVNQEFKKRKR